MGLLNKLKNVLFEEEEIEEVVEEKVASKPEIHLPKMEKEPKVEEYNVEEETDRELFKAEKTFDFPAFDEDEFEDFVPKKEEKPVQKERKVENTYSRSRDYTPTSVLQREEEPKKAFKPSPVMSPVYGILDKNYKKEDVVTREEIKEQKDTKLDVDSVRKKAFGTLEEDLEKTLNEPLETFYDEEIEETVEETNLENLLDKTIDIEIDVTKEMELPAAKRTDEGPIEENESTVELPTEELEEEIAEIDMKNISDVIDDVVEEEVVEKPEKIEETTEEVSDDTLENDLFELIDSMYENREGED